MRREFAVLAPPHATTDEVERLLARVATENGASIVRRSAGQAPPRMRWWVRSPARGSGTLEVTATPARIWLSVRDDKPGTWAGPRAAPFAKRLSELLSAE